MDLYQQREEDLNEHIKKYLELQKKLEDQLRLVDDEKKKEKLKDDIEEAKKQRTTYEDEIETVVAKKREALANEMSSVTFDELDVVTKFILGMSPSSSESNFALTNLTKKISKNNLSQDINFLLTMGMSKVKEVSQFIELNVTLRPDFPEKLKAGFMGEYQRLRENGVKGDALFNSLQKFSCGYSSDLKKMAAGLAVLTYLFEKCELFEK